MSDDKMNEGIKSESVDHRHTYIKFAWFVAIFSIVLFTVLYNFLDKIDDNNMWICYVAWAGLVCLLISFYQAAILISCQVPPQFIGNLSDDEIDKGEPRDSMPRKLNMQFGGTSYSAEISPQLDTKLRHKWCNRLESQKTAYIMFNFFLWGIALCFIVVVVNRYFG